MTMATFGIHEDLVDEGFDPDSDEYYTEVNNRLRNSFPAQVSSSRRANCRSAETSTKSCFGSQKYPDDWR